MNENNINNWQRLKKLLVFQVKLAFDALRDLLLSPVSIICTIVDMVKGHDNNHSRFNQLMKLGDKTDSWLNLFNHSPKFVKEVQIDKQDSALSFSSFDQKFPEQNVDQIFDKVETIIRQQHQEGKLTTSAKASINAYLDKLTSKNREKFNSTDAKSNAEDGNDLHSNNDNNMPNTPSIDDKL